MIPIYKPYLPASSLQYAHDAIDSTWLSSQGKYLGLVQNKLQELLGAKYVLPVNNGTSACHLTAKAVTQKYGKENIIVPNSVYAAAWNAFLFDNEYTLHCIPANEDTWNFDLDSLDRAITARPDAAILCVHNIGNIINVPELQKKYPNTVFVEDNCEGFLGKYNGVYTGTASFVSAISFFGNKNITSGEGGAFVTNDEEAYLHAKCIFSQGQSSTRFVHSHLGYNYRMTNIQAALLYGQLEILPEIMDKKQAVFEAYRHALKDHDTIKMQVQEENTEHSNWMFGVRVLGKSNYQEAELYFKGHGIEVRPMFYPIQDHAHLRSNPYVNWVPNDSAEILNEQCVILPSYPSLTSEEQTHILNTLHNYAQGK